MNLQRLSGIVLLLSFGLIVVGFALSPPSLYQETDFDARLQIIADHSARFAASQIVSVAGIVATAVGYLICAMSLRGRQAPALIYSGAAAFVVAGISVVIAIYPSLVDPASFLESALSSPWAVAFTWSTIAGNFLYGLVFLRGNFPMWLGYLVLGAAALVGVAALLVDPAVAEVLFLLPLLVGIVLVRRKEATT